MHPSGYRDRDPRIVIADGVAWAVWTRVQPMEGCGDGSEPVGVYFRTRQLPNGTWSAEHRFGIAAHELESFDVANGTVYAIVRDNGNDKFYFETLSETTFHRYAMPSTMDGNGTVRVDRIGRAWVAYETAKGVRIARFTGKGFTSVSMGARAPGGSTFSPDILFDSANHAYVTWIREPDQGGGCVTRDVEPADGIYFATNASGTWKTQRITHRLGEYSVALDGSGRLRLVLNGWDGRLRYIAQMPSGTFNSTILSRKPLVSPQILVDPATGATVVTYLPDRGGSTTSLAIMTHS